MNGKMYRMLYFLDKYVQRCSMKLLPPPRPLSFGAKSLKFTAYPVRYEAIHGTCPMIKFSRSDILFFMFCCSSTAVLLHLSSSSLSCTNMPRKGVLMPCGVSRFKNSITQTSSFSDSFWCTYCNSLSGCVVSSESLLRLTTSLSLS